MVDKLLVSGRAGRGGVSVSLSQLFGHAGQLSKSRTGGWIPWMTKPLIQHQAKKTFLTFLHSPHQQVRHLLSVSFFCVAWGKFRRVRQQSQQAYSQIEFPVFSMWWCWKTPCATGKKVGHQGWLVNCTQVKVKFSLHRYSLAACYVCTAEGLAIPYGKHSVHGSRPRPIKCPSCATEDLVY